MSKELIKTLLGELSVKQMRQLIIEIQAIIDEKEKRK